MTNDNIFTAIDENGNEKKYKMLYIKNVDNIPIIWYTDGSIDEYGRSNIFISSYEKTDNAFLLNSIDNEQKMQEYINIFIDNNS